MNPSDLSAASTVALVERYYAAFNAGDMATFFVLVTPDVVHDVNQGGREVGLDAFKAFMARMNACYRERVADLVVMATPDGTRAAAEFVIHGTYLKADGTDAPPAHGQNYVLPVGAFFEISGGRVARITNYYNAREWMRQVGVR